MERVNALVTDMARGPGRSSFRDQVRGYARDIRAHSCPYTQAYDGVMI
jgi:hypothetical protein